MGIICICMPAFPRFVQHVAPRLFGSTHRDSRLYDEATTARPSGFSARKRNPMRASVFEGGIVKTVGMTVEAMRASDDEVRLVVLNQEKKSAPSSAGSRDGAWEMQLQLPDNTYDGHH